MVAMIARVDAAAAEAVGMRRLHGSAALRELRSKGGRFAAFRRPVLFKRFVVLVFGRGIVHIRHFGIQSAVFRLRALCAADGAVFVHFFRCAGRFADARGQVFPAVLGIQSAVFRLRTLRAADGAAFVHFFRCAGRFADARGQVFPAVLGKGCGGQHRQCHDEHKQNTEQSFLHGDSSLSSGVSRPPWEAR